MLIILHCIRAILYLPKGAIEEAQRTVAIGAIAGLQWKTAATLVKTISAASWQSIGVLSAILAIRTLLKKTFISQVHRHQR